MRRSGRGHAALAACGAAVVLTALYLWSYRDCLGAFFHFDDFWVLEAAHRIHIGSPLDVLQFFVPVNGFLLYRPISTVLYFWVLHLCFGYDPTGYHATQIAFHIANALLVYAIADTLFFSRAAALASALVYATAPGHAIAACWMALFTATGTAFFYLLALWVWLRADSWWRVPATLLLAIVALLAGELAVSLPLALTLAAVLVEARRDWRRNVRELSPFYFIAGCYVAAKLYYLHHLLPTDFPSPAAQAYVHAGYGVSLAPRTVLQHLGRYVGFSLDFAYGVLGSEASTLGIGVLWAGLATVATLLVLTGRWQARPLRVATFGLDLFIVALGPVLVLPGHFFSYYVSIAALGSAVALIGVARALPRVSRIAPWLVVAGVVALHGFSTAKLVRQGEEFHFFDGFSRSAARWLYALSSVTNLSGVEEVVVPANGVTHMLFTVGRAHEVFLCASYRVRTSAAIEQVQAAPGRLIVPEFVPLPPLASGRRSWDWLRQPCAQRQRVHAE